MPPPPRRTPLGFRALGRIERKRRGEERRRRGVRCDEEGERGGWIVRGNLAPGWWGRGSAGFAWK
jgi:hypothetical protein